MSFNKTEIKYIRTALAINNIYVDDKTADLIWRTVWKVKELGGEFSLDDAATLQVSVEYDHKEARLQQDQEIKQQS